MNRKPLPADLVASMNDLCRAAVLAGCTAEEVLELCGNEMARWKASAAGRWWLSGGQGHPPSTASRTDHPRP